MTEGLRLRIWREVSRHLEIAGSLEGLWPLLREELPLHGLVVYRWDDARAELFQLAAAGALPAPDSRHFGVPTPKAAELRAFAGANRTVVWHDRLRTTLARVLVPERWSGPCGAGPLVSDGDVLGFVVLGGDLLGREGELGELLEPLTVALQNDRRLQALARLTEAAEADRRALLQRLERTEVAADTVVGADGGLGVVMRRVDQVARTDVPVLVLGETGTGKEVVARELHLRSSRARGPFLRVNCGAIPTELVDAELFGHERGAFTGAVAARKGWFERADGGTLFLDEIGELPHAAQVRLLRVLQDGAVQRVGGSESRTVDVRIVAATHRDLYALQKAGAFREDLWYRISVFPIHLPPLRERKGDLPALARLFAERAGQRLHGVALAPSETDLQRLGAYHWPGNVRELAAVIERAVILGGGERLDLATALGGPEPAPAAPPAADERAELLALLARCHGRIEGPFGAAAALATNPATLRSRMRRLGVDWQQFRKRA